jgi:hypothetical protein
VTLASRKFSPRTITRTGFTEWPAHQFGGSTFSTVGACANTPATKPQTTKMMLKQRMIDITGSEVRKLKTERNHQFSLFAFQHRYKLKKAGRVNV